MSCGVGHRHLWNLTLLWLWCRPEAIALIQPLAWEPPYGEGMALKRQKKKKKVIQIIILYIHKTIDTQIVPEVDTDNIWATPKSQVRREFRTQIMQKKRKKKKTMAP